ncbi:hypothetical protein Q1695_010783 [Nippostrongylus brasiliensis]|nr:hypothetical protein Q1695_010783 [Nippostrongylus brasiliensis]
MKRDLIQGLRGWGALFIFLFHHYTKYFPNSYIGSDIIIVISGFVAADRLRKERIVDGRVVQEFIVSKAKRILSLYYLALFLIIIFCYLVLPISYQQTNLERSKTALLLISNIKLSCFENNFSVMLPSIEDAFGHLWLPCLILQWYVVAPFLFRIQRKVMDKDKIFFGGVAVVSMMFFLFSRRIVATYWIHTRLWQFCAGVAAALHLPKNIESATNALEQSNVAGHGTYLSLDHDSSVRQEKHKTLSVHTDWMQYGRSFLRHPIFFLPLLIPLLWFRFPSFDLRLYITLATTLLLYAGHRDEIFPFVTNRFTVGLGTIFYPLYLAHWPAFSLAKYGVDFVPNSVEIGIVISVGIAFFTVNQLNNIYNKMSLTVTRLMYTFMIVITAVLSMKTVEFESDELHYTTISFADAFYDILNSIF